MASGTATNKTCNHPAGNPMNAKDAASGLAQGRDALDQALTNNLRRLRRADAGPDATRSDSQDPGRAARIAPPASSQTAPTEETLLHYIEGSLDTQTHAQVEQHLLSHPHKRAQVAALKGALASPREERAQAASSARLVFCWFGGTLRYLRGSCELEDEHRPSKPGSEPATSAGNAAKPSYKFSYSFPSAEALLFVSPSQPHNPPAAPESPEHLSMMVSLSRAAGGVDAQVTTVGGSGARTCSCDAEGRLNIDGLGVGRHAVSLRRAGVELGTVLVDVRSA